MEDMAEKFREARYSFITASHFDSGLSRGAHMVATAIWSRRNFDVSVIDVYSGRAFMWAEGVCYALRVLRKPYILTLRGGNLPVFAMRWPRRVRRLLKSAAAVTSPSRFLLEQMKSYRGDVLMLPNPVNIEAYSFQLRRQVHPRLMWLRSFHAMYNPAMALRVLAELVRDYPDMRLTMIGLDKRDGSLQRTLKLAAKLRLREHLTVTCGIHKKDVPARINQGDIFLNTTNVDNTPISVLEAMACGLCVVSTRVGGIPYLLEHDRDALLVPPDDPDAMAAAVRRLMTEPGLAERISRNARVKAEQFDINVIMPRWKELVGTIARAGDAQ
jgi:glycosyltransferase involved in cell wall biosynthesis